MLVCKRILPISHFIYIVGQAIGSLTFSDWKIINAHSVPSKNLSLVTFSHFFSTIATLSQYLVRLLCGSLITTLYVRLQILYTICDGINLELRIFVVFHYSTLFFQVFYFRLSDSG